MSAPRLAELTEILSGVSIVHHLGADGSLWATSGRRILRLASNRREQVARFPFVLPRDLLGFSRPTARAARADRCNLFVNAAGFLLGIRASTLYALREPGRLIPLARIRGDSVLHGGICEDLEGSTYLGEYFLNPSRRPVRIWRLARDLSIAETAHEFGPGEVRHVHGVYRDPFDPQALWVTTGDEQGECYLFRTRDRFRSLERFGEGTQTWRAVRLFFTPDHVCWLTDSPSEPNRACRMRRAGGGLELGQSVDATVWYGAQTTDGLYLAFTTVEPGRAVRRRQSQVLVSRDAFTWHEAATFEKDRWRPARLFKYGVISAPSGPMSSDRVYLNGEGLRGLDGVCARMRLHPEVL